MLQQLRDVGVHFVAFGDNDAHVAGLSQVVEERRAAVVSQHVPQRHDGELIDGRDRSLRAGIVGTQRLDRVAHEFEAHGVRGPGREDIQDAAAPSELAVLVGRVLAVEARIDQQLGQILRGDVLPGFRFIDALSTCRGALTRGSSAAADAIITRAVPLASACRAAPVPM